MVPLEVCLLGYLLGLRVKILFIVLLMGKKVALAMDI
jgi:hypothetical protein